jgi:hypothetical protein
VVEKTETDEEPEEELEQIEEPAETGESYEAPEEPMEPTAICERCGREIYTDVAWEVPVATDELNNIMWQTGSTPLEYYNPAEHDYQLFVEDVTWEEAEARCEEMGGHLASFACKEEIEKVEGYFSDIGADQQEVALHIWFGVRCQGQDADGNCYLTGVVPNENLGISNWYPGEPSHYDPNSGEEEMYLDLLYKPGTSQNGDWVWLDVPNDICGAYSGHIAYLCEWEHVVAE